MTETALYELMASAVASGAVAGLFFVAVTLFYGRRGAG